MPAKPKRKEKKKTPSSSSTTSTSSTSSTSSGVSVDGVAPVSSVVVEFKDVSVKYGPKVVFDNLCWRVNDGENWVVQGANGAGKSTVVDLITGESSGVEWSHRNALRLYADRYQPPSHLATQPRTNHTPYTPSTNPSHPVPPHFVPPHRREPTCVGPRHHLVRS